MKKNYVLDTNILDSPKESRNLDRFHHTPICYKTEKLVQNFKMELLIKT